ncbi:DUF4190 domain-containing protein [Streptomyces sp. NPDC058299]|uniref:DUF4190 domain-containing protein n=1 Tax=unclassified Streptomyces TaxID=2593676 RepID=UPI0036E91FDC
MSDEVPQSTPGEQAAGHGSGALRVSLDKDAAARAAGEAPVRDAVPAPGSGPGSVHEQRTLTSFPTAPEAPAGAAAPWASPAAGSAPTSPAQRPNPLAQPTPATQGNPYAPPSSPSAQQPNPYAPPASTPAPQGNPYVPPASASTPAPQPNPFGPPAGIPQPNPYAPPVPPAAGQGAADPVPPPPIAPGGPGQVPYGYPGTAPAYGYPGTSAAPYGGGTGYAWPGTQPLPNNGMGTASLVLGIIAAAGFLLWPVALVLGVLAVIFGAVGRSKARHGEATNPGVALAGIICGAAGIVLVAALFAFAVAVYT